jgi:hypothetical protein
MTTVVNVNRDEYDIYIGRGSKWGNPYTHIKDRATLAEFVVGTREEAMRKYREHVLASPELMESLHELRDKRIACFCKPSKSCHGDILVELLEEQSEGQRFYSIF